METPDKGKGWVNQLLTGYQWESILRINDKEINNIPHDRREDKFSKPKIFTSKYTALDGNIPASFESLGLKQVPAIHLECSIASNLTRWYEEFQSLPPGFSTHISSNTTG